MDMSGDRPKVRPTARFGMLAALAAMLGSPIGAERGRVRKRSTNQPAQRSMQIHLGKSGAYRKRKREFEAKRRALYAEGENLGSQALHNERRRGAGHWRQFSVGLPT